MNNSAGKGDDMNSEQYLGNEKVSILTGIRSAWEDIVSNSERLTDLSQQNVVFAAGGGLVTRFGDNDSEIWRSMVDHASEGRMQVAGIDFEIEDLEAMGAFYRFFKSKYGYNFHCIDERLEGNENHLDKEVHAACGACAAVGVSAHLDNVEDRLLSELGQNAKKEIYGDMPHHESIVILVDYSGADVVLGDFREELKQKKALPFNVSIPLIKISEYVQDSQSDVSRLVATLTKWNVQIARNIIGGTHNALRDLSDETIIAVDKRNVESSQLSNFAFEQLQLVQHGDLLELN